MRILVIGSGGREHALVWKLSQSPRVRKIFAAPGNPGMGELAECIPISPDQVVTLADFAVAQKVDLTVVGPEAPLVGGLTDYFEGRNLPVFGPSKAAARLEGSKVFAKEMMRRAGVATAPFQVVGDFETGLNAVRRGPLPVVVKADGLAGGKGAVVARTREEAVQAVTRMLQERLFGEAGARVVLEECLEGEELSVLGVSDGSHVLLLAPSQDHKRIFDGDRGPNTGGMGAYSPVPMVEEKQLEAIRASIFEPVLRAMREAGTPFRGLLYAGLMLTAQGPRVLEFNVRFGDPEAQAVLPRLKTDLAELMLAGLEGGVDRIRPGWEACAAACVVLASGGYPGQYDLGHEITGLEAAAQQPNTLIFHAGTRREGGRFLTYGGRVLNVVGLGEGRDLSSRIESALSHAYQAVEKIQFKGKQFRRDIGARALKQVGGVLHHGKERP